MPDPEDEPAEFSSPPCFAHEGERHAQRSADADNVLLWRKSERERLIALRIAIPVEERTEVAAAIAKQLDLEIRPRPGIVISLYWPFRGELDFRPWMRTAFDEGARIALPVVVGKGEPLIFREWRPGVAMERGVWNIPIPSMTQELSPDVVLSPLVGYDDACFRLGYGGGFYDRTLAARQSRPLVVGVGHPAAHMSTIRPQRYDIPMDVILTGKNTIRRAR